MQILVRKRNKKGFTLVELIVVIAILAILAVAAVVVYSNIAEGAEEVVIMADANSIARAVNTYNALAEEKIEDVEKIIKKYKDGKVDLDINGTTIRGIILIDLSVTIDKDKWDKIKDYITGDHAIGFSAKKP